MKRRWIQIEGKLYEVGVDEIPGLAGDGLSSCAVYGDSPDFVSPIDGSVVSGRAGMREHCKRHDVIPNQELAGLKPRTYGNGNGPSQKEREQTKRTMYQIADHRGYFSH